MTIVSIAFKKPTPMPKHFALPVVKENEDVEKLADEEIIIESEGKIEILCWHIVVAVLIVAFCFVLVFTSYQERFGTRRENLAMHYKGFCTIPIENIETLKDLEEIVKNAPVRWSRYDDYQMFGNLWNPSDQMLGKLRFSGNEIGNALREKLDITDSIEVISVFNNGRSIKFIHDFSENTTGIVDDERCFTMDLDPDVVLEPVMFVMGIDGNKDFDTTRMHTKMEAVLPELDASSKPHMLAENCESKPTYKLERCLMPALRKRSADLPNSDYIQFSGKHIQEIAINNLQLVLDHERNKATGN